VARPWDYFGLPQSEHLLSESLRAAGYQTAIVGKWHLGHSHVKQTPTRRGFDQFYGHLLGALDYYTHSRFGGIDWQRNGETLHEEGYTTDLIGKEAARIIDERDPEKPLFLYVPFNAPHSPMQAPKELIDRYSGISSEPNLAAHAAFIQGVADRLEISVDEAAGILDPPGDAPRAIFAAMVHSMDVAVGRILAALDRAEITDDTIVLFFSDNGGHISLGASNTPLRGEKSTVFEGGIRVPAAVRWPAGLEGGRRVSQTISVLDVFPTLIAAAGITAGNAQPFDGVDRWPQIRGDAAVAPGEIFFGVDGVVGRQEALRHGRWKLIRALGFEGDPVEIMLFDVEGDPTEQTDLASQQPARTADLLARLDRWVALYPEGGAQGIHWPHPGWVPPRDYGAAVRTDAVE
jgi:arylsulfatase A-like enzyme